jgi:hypothetical protein
MITLSPTPNMPPRDTYHVIYSSFDNNMDVGLKRKHFQIEDEFGKTKV